MKLWYWLGSPVAETNTSGNLVGSFMHYQAFGETIEAPKDEVGYTGHKFDTDLGLSYMQARYYDPVIGRFYSNDPDGYVSRNPVHSFNRYAYASNNPFKFIDPDGREVKYFGSKAEVATMKAAFNKVKGSSPAFAKRAIQLESSKNTHMIVATPGNNNPGINPLGDAANASNGNGSGSVTSINPGAELTTTNKDGSTVINSPEAIMAHEVFGHGVDMDSGTFDESIAPNGEPVHENRALGVETEYKDTAHEKSRDCVTTC